MNYPCNRYRGDPSGYNETSFSHLDALSNSHSDISYSDSDISDSDCVSFK